MIRPLDESTRTVLDTTVKCATLFLGFALFSIAVFAIVRCLPGASAIYKKLLIFVTVVAELNDLYLIIFLHPVFLFPAPCLSINGLLAYTNVPTSTAFEVWVSSLSASGIPYGMCFMYRHQILLPPNHRFHLSTFKSTLLLSAWTFVFMSNGPMFELVRERSINAKEWILQELSDEWPNSIRTHSECADPSRTFVACGWLIITISFSLFLICLVSAHTFHTLNEMPMISEKTRNIHRRLTKWLIVQASIPTVIIFLPDIALIIQFLSGFEAAAFAPLMVHIIGTHTIVHSITVILSTEILQNYWSKKISSGSTKIRVSPQLS